MKITLRKAAVLQNAINDVLKQIDIKSEVALTEFHQPEVEITRAALEVKTNILRRERLNQALYDIRHRVSVANHESGVNQDLTAVASLEKQIQFYTGLAGKEVRESAEVLAGKLNKLLNAEAKSRIYGYGDTVNTSVFTAEDIAGFKKTVSDLKKSKQQLQDSILELNVRTEVELNDTVVEILRAEGLI